MRPVTGGTQFFTFSGGLLGPPVFGAIAAASSGYGFGFVLLALLPLANALWLLAPERQSGTQWHLSRAHPPERKPCWSCTACG